MYNYTRTTLYLYRKTILGGDIVGEIVYYISFKGRKQMEEKTVNQVADFFLSKESMSPKKLQKLVYYAYAWTLSLLNIDENSIEYTLFNEPIEAWVHGPVCPDLYFKFKSYGWGEIPKRDFKHRQLFSVEELDIMEQVWNVYGKFTGNELESITHQEEPWNNARKGLQPYEAGYSVINNKTIFKYYNQQSAE